MKSNSTALVAGVLLGAGIVTAAIGGIVIRTIKTAEQAHLFDVSDPMAKARGLWSVRP